MTKLDLKKYSGDPSSTTTFTMQELEAGIVKLQLGKPIIGLDNIATEQLKNFGPEAKK